MSESYVLAIDIGTSRIAAAKARVASDGSIEASPVALGRRSDSVATVVFVANDGTLFFGDAAERRGLAQPDRLVREFKRGIGDDVPLTLGGRSFRPEELYAQTFASIVDEVAEREGSRPSAVSLTHPAAWGGHRTGLIRAALRRLGIDDVEFITEPEAAAHHYEATRPLEPGQALAVYDLGGGTFDSVVLRKGEDSAFGLIGEAIGLDDFGGADFDDAVLRHVVTSAGIDVATLQADDPDTRLALAQVRRECIEAKEALSFDTDATIPLVLQANLSSVRLTRSEFEQMINGSLDKTLDALDDTIDSAGIRPDELEAILLVGGSSRIPLVAQRLSEKFDRPLAIDADPKAAIALGAARTALARINAQRLASGGALAPIGATDALGAFDAIVAGSGAELEPITTTPVPAPTRAVGRRKSPLMLAGAAVLVAGAIVFASTIAAGSLSSQDVDAAEASRPTPSASTPAPKQTPAVASPDAAAQTDDASQQTTPNPRRSLAVESTPRPDTPRTTPPASTTPPSSQPSNPSQPVDPPTTGPTTPPPPTEPSTPPPTDPEPPTEPDPDPDPEPTVDPEESPAPDPGPDTPTV